MAHSKLVDTHTHSLFSSDSKMPFQAALEQAQQKGLAGIVFTEHYDFDVPAGISAFEFDPKEQQHALREICDQSPIASCLQVMAGIEVGMQPHSIEKINTLLESHSFDQIIASIHFVDGKDPYHGGYYVGLTPKQAYGRYLELIFECITQMTNFDILGHFDYIARYSPYPESITYRDYADIFDAIFRQMISNGQALELNTKTYYLKPDGHPQPDPAIYKRYLELGGEMLSLGSDAHKTEHIGIRFEEYADWAKSLGFRYSVYYRERKAIPLPL